LKFLICNFSGESTDRRFFRTGKKYIRGEYISSDSQHRKKAGGKLEKTMGCWMLATDFSLFHILAWLKLADFSFYLL